MPAPTNLVTIRPGVTLAAPAAASWQRMETEAGRQLQVSDSYRSWEKQYDLWRRWITTGRPPVALHPDESMHCKGLAVDTNDQSAVLSMPLHGWRQTALDIREPWHFDYFTELDIYAGSTAGGGDKPLPTTPRKGRAHMVLYYADTKDGRIFALAGTSPGTPANWLETKGQALANGWAAQVGGNAVLLSESQFYAWKRDYLAPLAVAGA